MKKKVNQANAILIVVALFLVIVTASLGAVLVVQSSETMKDTINTKMLDTSRTVASMIDGDVLGKIKAEDKNTPEYQKILKLLRNFQENTDFKFVYCVRKTGNKKYILTIDPTDESSEEFGEFGEPLTPTKALDIASLGDSAVSEEPYDDTWGTFYSAYTPVHDSNGKITGLVGVDLRADWYEDQVLSWVKSIVIITVLALIIGIITVLLFSSRLRKKYRDLYHELENLSGGIEVLSKELSGDETPKGLEFLENKEEKMSLAHYDVAAISEKIRNLEKYMSIQIDHVRDSAYKDGLTGLGNRSAYTEYTAMLEEQIKNRTADFSVAVFDINGLKEINDKQGHEEGDNAIMKAAEVLREAFPDEKVFRIGGDEFVVIIDYTGEKAEALMNEADKLNAVTKFGNNAYAIMSSGFAEYDQSQDTIYRNTFGRADKAMYENKKKFYETYGNRRKH